MLVNIHYGCRRDPIGVIAIADERRSTGDTVSAFRRSGVEWTAELGGDHNVRTTTVDLLCSLVGETCTKKSPVQRVLQRPAGGRVVTTYFFDDERARDGVCLQSSQRPGR
jgi:hypothetical protein